MALCMQLSKAAATGNASLSYKMMRLTDRMDVKVAVGGTWTWNPRSARPFNVVRHQLVPVSSLAESNISTGSFKLGPTGVC